MVVWVTGGLWPPCPGVAPWVKPDLYSTHNLGFELRPGKPGQGVALRSRAGQVTPRRPRTTPLQVVTYKSTSVEVCTWHKLIYKLMTTEVRYDKEILVASHLERIERDRIVAA